MSVLVSGAEAASPLRVDQEKAGTATIDVVVDDWTSVSSVSNLSYYSTGCIVVESHCWHTSIGGCEPGRDHLIQQLYSNFG